MTAGEYCNREVVIVEPNATILEAAKLMRQHHVGDLIVVEKRGDQNIPVGLITDRDLVIKVLANGGSPKDTTVQNIMSQAPVTVTEAEALLDALALMRHRGVRRLPVVNSNGGLEGLLCADDVIELIAEATDDLVKLIKREQHQEEMTQR